MIKLGHLKDFDADTVPNCISNQVLEDLKMLDLYYGEERDVDNDMGGFVVICDKYEDLKISGFDESQEYAEYNIAVDEYQKALYISGTERNIIVYRSKLNKRMLQK